MKETVAKLQTDISDLQMLLDAVVRHGDSMFDDLRDKVRALDCLFHAVARMIPVPLVIVDKGGRIMFSNDRAVSAFGYSGTELLPANAADLYARPEDRERFLKMICEKGVAANYEAEMKKRDGTSFWVEMFSQLLNYQDREAILTVVCDITERKRTEEREKRIRDTEIRDLSDENRSLRDSILTEKPKHPEAFSEIVTENSQMISIFLYCEAIAKSAKPVLITGETGVGKELFARAIHFLSGRKGKMSAVNAGGLDERMFYDELFGHVAGAFTSADKARDGQIVKTANGTLFLDEIGELSPECQVKLLRLLEQKEYSPIGSDKIHKSKTRIVAITNRAFKDLKVDTGFRQDLLFRIDTHHVHVPPLRERSDDIPILADHFLGVAARELGRKKPTPPPELAALLKTYSFPGNVRELKSMVYDAVARHRKGVISLSAFAEYIKRAKSPNLARNSISGFDHMTELPTLKNAAKLLIDEALKRTNGNKSMAARMLGLTPQALCNRLRRVEASPTGLSGCKMASAGNQSDCQTQLG